MMKTTLLVKTMNKIVFTLVKEEGEALEGRLVGS